MVGLGTILISGAGAVILVGVLVRLWEEARQEAPFRQVTIGMVWLVAWSLVDGVGLLAGQSPSVCSGWPAAAVVAGIGQVLAGSLAYLVPVLAGPPLRENGRG